MKLRFVRANPAGNITLFVLDPVEPAERPGLAAQLMRLPDSDAEQVAFVCPPLHGGDGRLEMMGGEFCGNATRSMGALLAKERGIRGRARYLVEAGGCEQPVAVDVDMVAGTARAAMPLPRVERRAQIGDVCGTLIDLSGIVHYVVHHSPDEAIHRAVEKELAADGMLPEALGVIFLHDGKMTPLVKVIATGTLIWEGSCGSGALAAAAAESRHLKDGSFAADYRQPAGVIRAELTRRAGRIVEAYIGGSVSLDEPTVITR